MSRPVRIRLSRSKGLHMPENAVKVDRTTKWGNPFIVGTDGTRADCVDLYRVMLAGCIVLTRCPECPDAQLAYIKHLRRNLRHLRGKNLACWCPLPKPGEPDLCHAAVLLDLANR